ncbi:MAG: response regulator [Candidatus Promineifilaceae bacterium]
MTEIKTLVADDHQLFRDGIKALLQSAPDTELVGEASSGEEVISLAARLKPDVILMDLQMPGVNGIEATQRIIERNPNINILILTMFDDDQSVFAAIRAGARGYVLKGVKHDEMLRAIRAVASGEAIFSPDIAQRMMSFFANVRPAEASKAFPELTLREREILELLARDYSNAEIAAELVISPKTVRNHVSNILGKLQVADRREAGTIARDAGFGL